MNRIMGKISNQILLWMLLSLGIWACSNHHGSDTNHNGIMHNIENQEYDSVDIKIDELMEEVRKVLADVPESQREFYVLERKTMITGYPCSSCHDSPPPKFDANQGDNTKKGHWDIKLGHAGTDIMDCRTCHSSDNSDQLVLLSGKPISFDHSYKQCAQCHSTQHKDWLGGAHGKRVIGWVAPKVVYNCTSCHNAHNPGFKPRWPARFNTVKIKERQSD